VKKWCENPSAATRRMEIPAFGDFWRACGLARLISRAVARFAPMRCLSALLVLARLAAAEPASCPRNPERWVKVVFSGAGWSVEQEQDVLRELGVELKRRALEVCTDADADASVRPLKLITLIKSDRDRVAIVPSDLEDEGGFVGRTIVVAAIPEDARALAIAQAVDEALRSDSGPLSEPLPPPPPPPTIPPSPKPEEPRPPSEHAPLTLGAAVAPMLLVAPATFQGSTRAVFAPGAALRLSLVRRGWGGSLGVAVTKTSSLHYESVAIQQFRVPLDLSVRSSLRRGALEGILDVGMLAALVDYEFSPNGRGHRQLELGGRVSVAVEWGEKILPLLGISCEIVPSTSQISFAPVGPVGRTPAFWLGVALGTEVRWP